MGTSFTTMRSLARTFANAMNLISPEVENHHERVAYFAVRLAEARGMSEREKRLTFYAALLHDVGSVMTEGSPNLLELELRPGDLANASAMLLRMLPATVSVAEIVKDAQSPWKKLARLPGLLRTPGQIAQIVHLSDAVSLLLREDQPILNQVAFIRECLQRQSGEFSPEVLAAFDAVSSQEALWMDLMYRPQLFLEHLPDDRPVSLQEALRLTELVSRVIDFRSPFTAMHSAGVAATAESLAELAGMSEEECLMMRIAGNLHDIGKLKIPKSILEKPGKLTDEEFNVMKEHAYYTYVLLKDMEGFEQITRWAAFHHEKLNGSGYPFRLQEHSIPLGSRVMAVADVFSAITEDRPYRKGMEKERALEVLRQDAARGALSSMLVELLIVHYDTINAKREEASRQASKRYQESLKQMREGQEQ